MGIEGEYNIFRRKKLKLRSGRNSFGIWGDLEVFISVKEI